MNKSFSFPKFDEQGRARLINEIKALWEAISKISVTPTEIKLPDTMALTLPGYAQSVDKFLNEQGDYTALDSTNTSITLSKAVSMDLQQSTVISNADSVIDSEHDSKNISQSTNISVADSKADSVAGGGTAFQVIVAMATL